MARFSPAPLIALCTLCLCAAAASSPALAAGAKARHATPDSSQLRRSRQCPKSGGHPASSRRPHGRHGAGGCSKRRSGVRRSVRRSGVRRSVRRSGVHRSGVHHVSTVRTRKAPHGATRRAGSGKAAPAPAIPLPVDGSCPDSTLSPTQWNLSGIRIAVLCLVNRERDDHGERPLAPNARLQQAAQAHTESMAFGDYFNHIGPRGETPLSRVRAAGYIDSSLGYEVGENIAWGTLWEGTPRAIVAAWMASPGHRANILDPRFRETGIGVSPHPPSCLAENQPGGIYTQDFGGIIS